MKYLFFFNLWLFLLCENVVLAQSKAKEVPMSSSFWEVAEMANCRFETFDGRETLVLNGKATVKGVEFSNGTLEVDVYTNAARSFGGISFRKQDGTMEEVYMRLHKSKQPDAVQYTPIFNQESAWQLYKEHQANVTFKNKGWNHLRLEAQGNTVEVTVNGERVLVVDELKTGLQTGEIGLFALFDNRFSNFRFTKSDQAPPSEELLGKINAPSEVIKEWKISEAFPFQEGGVDPNKFLTLNYKKVDSEDSGLLPLSKYIVKPSSGSFEANAEAYAVASIEIHSNRKQVKEFFFDYSDKIMVYLNGELLFSGNNAFRSKGVQYMGHLAIDANRLYLNLEEGKNMLHCIVIDRANGWGLMGGLRKVK